MPCPGDRTEAIKAWYRIKQWEDIRYVDVISLYPNIFNMASFLWVTRKWTWMQAVPLIVWIGKGLQNVRFCHLGNCIIETDAHIFFCMCRHHEPKLLYTLEKNQCKLGKWVVDEVHKAV